MARVLTILVCVALGAAVCGCIARCPLAEGELARFWSLHESVWDKAASKPLSVGGRTLPSRWTFRHEPSILWATVSMVRAAQRLEAGTEEVEVAVSPTHAAAAADILAEARRTLLDLREIADADSVPTCEQWAATVARGLVFAERVARRAGMDEAERGRTGRGEPLGWSVGPMLEMAFGYLNERTGGALLEDLDAGDVGRVRAILAQVFLRVGFALAGKREPAGLCEAVAQAMRRARRPADLESSLRKMLLARFPEAPSAPSGSGLTALLDAVFSWGPRMFEVLIRLAQQWDRVESVSLEFRTAGGASLACVTLNVAPGREVRIADLIIFQPALVFRGRTRIIVGPEDPATNETVVLFEPVRDGAAEVRFEGPGYGLVRLLALPLADAALREVRVAQGRSRGGRRMVNVVVLMEATGEEEDPRRLMAYHDVRCERLVRRTFQVERRTERKEQVFTYLTPKGRYTYRRVKRPGG